jgi:hypothetical protein
MEPVSIVIIHAILVIPRPPAHPATRHSLGSLIVQHLSASVTLAISIMPTQVNVLHVHQ